MQSTTPSSLSVCFIHTVFGFVLALLANPARASIDYWDPTGTMPICSPNGTWENASWVQSPALSAGEVNFTEGSLAVFGAGTAATCAYTVTANANHTIAGIYDSGVLGTAIGNVTINGIGTLIITSGLQGFNVGNEGSLTISNTLAGSGTLTAEGYGQLFLNGVNTYSGGTFLGYSGAAFGGVINFNSTASFGTGAITMADAGGPALVAEGTGAITITNAVVFTNYATLNLQGNAAGVTFSGPWRVSSGMMTLGLLGSGNLVTISGVISGAGGVVKALNSGSPLILSGRNTYTGNTIISSGVLSLCYSGSISDSPSISIAAGAALDVSGFTNGTFTLASGQSLTASGYGTTTNIGAATAAVLNGPAGGTVNLGSQPITLNFTPGAFNGDATHPSLYLPQGALELNGNAFTVNNASSAPLGTGTYVLIQQAQGAISCSGTCEVNVTGAGLASGSTAGVSVSGGLVNLIVQNTNNPPLGFVSPPAYDQGSGTFSVTYSGGPGLTYTIHTATNVVGPWSVLGTATANSNGVFQVSDTESPAAPARFYWITPPSP
jgi:hypothetical protein